MYRSKQDRENETLIRKLTYESSVSKDLWDIPSDILTAHVPINSYIQKIPNNVDEIAKDNELSKSDVFVNKDFLDISKKEDEIDNQIRFLEKQLEILGMQI